MSKKNKQAKMMEQEAAAPAEEQAEAAPSVEQAPAHRRAERPKVQFDAWWAARSAMIPAVHKKEIIKADMMGRKVPMVATMAEFDEALKKYGVELA